MPTLLDSKVESRQFVLPAQSNTYHTAHGGDVLKWMEQTSAMSAMTFSGKTVVTARFDRGQFHEPLPEGSIALLDAYVYETGTSSMTVRVRCFHDDHETGERQLATEATVVSVAVDEAGESLSVPDLSVATDRGEQLRAEALDQS
ncbi:acyl-CoA thioesterase [Halovenus marina]|uniref:acyl-CoA thioesterase n=1 Tax=Halovenus marina TaxID=3396621 RepID=UPI003F566E35